MAAISSIQSAKTEFTVSRSQVGDNSWTFTPVTWAARQWAAEAPDFGLPDGMGSYSVQDTFAAQELQRLHEEGIGVRFVTDHGPDDILEAALCIWEAMLEARGDNPVERAARNADPAEGAEWQVQLDQLWERAGTVQMRRYAADLAPEFLHVYDGLGGSDTLEELNLTPYDWEFIPAVLAHVEWESYGPSMNIQGVIAAMRELHSPAPALAPMTAPAL
ncbi:hypothetical protein [Xanthobacter flavus]|uniref:hypothetical protein n=1 Tax=Xanthobacter flavus TaxID=281 RepID=UPI003728FBB6